MGWDKDKPAGTDKIRLSDELLRENFAALETALSAEHSFTGSTPTGIHGTLSAATLTTPTIADFTNATHDHADAAGGGATLTSPTIVTPTIASFANATHDHQDAAGGGATLTSPTINTPTLTSPSSDDLTVTGSAASTPDANTLTKDHMIGARCTFNGTGTPAYIEEINFSGSITDNGGGDYTLTIDRDFANANYAALGAAGALSGGTQHCNVSFKAKAAGSINVVVTETAANTKTDITISSVVLFGAQ